MKITLNKTSFFLILFCLILIYTQNSLSLEIEGVNIPEVIKTNNESLVLNGAGIRTRFFFNIYIGSLYLKNKESDISKILGNNKTKRISLNFLYKEIKKEKLTNGWIDGFKNNNSDTLFKTLKKRIDKFNRYFTTTHKGDVVQLDFLATNKTRITINNEYKGEINGNDFQVALLKIWLGNDPADYNLKEAMLGETDF